MSLATTPYPHAKCKFSFSKSLRASEHAYFRQMFRCFGVAMGEENCREELWAAKMIKMTTANPSTLGRCMRA